MKTSEAVRIARELREGARQIQEQNATVEKERSSRKQALLKNLENDLVRARADHSKAMDTLRQERESFLEGLASRRKQREARITKALADRKRRRAEIIDESEGRRKFAVQKGLLDTERSRSEELSATKTDLEKFQENSQQWRGSFAELRVRFQRTYRGFLGCRKLLATAVPTPADTSAPAFALIEKVKDLHQRSDQHLHRSQANILVRLFRVAPLWVWIFLIALAWFIGPDRFGLPGLSRDQFTYLCLGAGAGAVILYLVAWQVARGTAGAAAAEIVTGESLIDLAVQKAEAQAHERTLQIRGDAEARIGAFNAEWETAIREASAGRYQTEGESTARADQARARFERIEKEKQERAVRRFSAAEESASRRFTETEAGLRANHERSLAGLESAYDAQALNLKNQWNDQAVPLLNVLQAADESARKYFPTWTSAYEFQPPPTALNLVKFGDLVFPALGIKQAAPLQLALPDEGHLLIETDDFGRARGIETLNNVVLRVLATIPPGKLSLTFIDPVRLGESFSSLMHLADFDENLVNRRIWTEPNEIEEKLFELNTHMEKVIQMYLRNEYPDIVAYNKQAGRIAEKYYFLVIADFPANLGDNAMRRLVKIIASGARCGVFALIHWDQRRPFPPGYDSTDFKQGAVHLQITRDGVRLPMAGEGFEIRLDPPPGPDATTQFLQAAGKAHSGSNVVQVPFAEIAPTEGNYWKLQTTHELRIPIGRSGATKLQYLSLGKGTRQHVLIAGKTGSGKSTLLHVIITNLALSCSPEEVEFYLVDFKKGVEFKDYALADLPHARVVAIESDREFGLSVLRKLDEELRRRGELFRAVSAQDIAAYKEDGRKLPRVLLIIDEFQELFVEDDSISQDAALLLDRIVRQGRAFGMHVVLGSQTLGGAYSLARSTLGQMVVRIALQSNEADAYLIMDENNPAPRLLSRPGEGIYNDASGRIEANSPFQVVWLDDKERHRALAVIRSLADKFEGTRRPIVFEGNHPADIEQNEELEALVSGESVDLDGPARAWIGLPNEIKGPTEIVFDARSGRNLLVVGQQDESARAVLAAAILSLAAHPKLVNAQFIILEIGARGQQLLHEIAGALPQHSVSADKHVSAKSGWGEAPAEPGGDTAHDGLARQEPRPTTTEALRSLPQKVLLPEFGDLEEVMRGLREELDRREAGQSGAPIFLIIHDLASFKSLRAEDDFSLSYTEKKQTAADNFIKMLSDGPVHGIHSLIHVDSYNNVNRFLGRKGLREIQARVLFQMSASDSSNLCDDPRASNLGLNRALLYEEQTGRFETFRPYARPSPEWLARYRTALEQRVEVSTREVSSLAP